MLKNPKKKEKKKRPLSFTVSISIYCVLINPASFLYLFSSVYNDVLSSNKKKIVLQQPSLFVYLFISFYFTFEEYSSAKCALLECY